MEINFDELIKKMEIDTTTPHGRLMLGILRAISEFESTIDKLRTSEIIEDQKKIYEKLKKE